MSLRANSKLPPRFWGVFWGLICPVAAFVPLMLVHFLQFPSLLLLPFSRRWFWAYNRPVAFMIWGWWAYSLQKFVGVRMIYSGSEIPREENAIVIANHQTMGDVPVMLCLALLKGRISDLKWLVKDELKYVPGIGWGLKFLDSVFLKRRWADDQERIANTFRRYIDMKSPMWLLLFPEGTRMTEKKLNEHKAVAVKSGKVVGKHLLAPRSKGFVASVQGLRSFVTAVYDMTIVYPGGKAPTLVKLMAGEVDHVYLDVQRFPIDELPSSDAELADWLRARFRSKDALIDSILAPATHKIS